MKTLLFSAILVLSIFNASAESNRPEFFTPLKELYPRALGEAEKSGNPALITHVSKRCATLWQIVGLYVQDSNPKLSQSFLLASKAVLEFAIDQEIVKGGMTEKGFLSSISIMQNVYLENMKYNKALTGDAIIGDVADDLAVCHSFLDFIMAPKEKEEKPRLIEIPGTIETNFYDANTIKRDGEQLIVFFVVHPKTEFGTLYNGVKYNTYIQKTRINCADQMYIAEEGLYLFYKEVVHSFDMNRKKIGILRPDYSTDGGKRFAAICSKYK